MSSVKSLPARRRCKRNLTFSDIASKCPVYNQNLSSHIRNQESYTWNENRQIIDSNPKMNQVLKLSDKDLNLPSRKIIAKENL
jgi:hypothetical protein